MNHRWVIRRLSHDWSGRTVERGHPAEAFTFEQMQQTVTKVLRLAWMHEAVEVRDGETRPDVLD